MSRRKLYREYDDKGQLVKLECTHCHEIKEVNSFSKSNVCKDGIRPTCKKCIAKRDKQYYENNKEKIKERSKQYRENNTEKVNECRKQWYENNKKYHKQYQENNKEKMREYQKQYQENNKEKMRECWKHYRENKTQEELIRIYKNFTKNKYPKSDIQYGVIYGVHCKTTDRWYVGQTTTSFKIRYGGNFFNHKFNELYDDSRKAQLLKDDIEKYGEENFEIFEVLDVAFSERELDEKEAYYIDYYKAYDEGYNSNRGNIFKHNKLKRKEVV